MSTLRWTAEQLAAHTAKLRKAVDSAPRPVGPILDAKSVRAKTMLDAVATAKPLKYRNKPTTDADGVKHASKKQATRYRDLGLLMKSGEIVMLAREVRFRLPGGVEYRADHVFCNQRALMVIAELIKDGDMICEDVKSDATRKDKVYKIKSRQMRECLGIEIKEA